MTKKDEPGIGHNSNTMPSTGEVASSEGVAADELKSFIERLERLAEEKAAIAEDLKEVFSELKGRGFDAAAVRAILKMRKADSATAKEQQAIIELYCQALGMENLFS